jgi:RecA-family ATPase
MKAFDVVERKLRDGMVEGQMHGCLRDVGRLAGGYAAAGAITASELFELEGLAASLSKNAAEGADKWCKAVVFGRGQPVQWNPEEFTAAKRDRALEWDDEIGGGAGDAHHVVDMNWLEDAEVAEPGDEWNGVTDLITYLSTLFQGDEHVAYTTESWEKEGKFLPSKGCWDRTAGQLIQELQKCKGDIHRVIGDVKPDVGGWIRFNPFDGKGIRDENVTEFRYALVESDQQSIERQIAILKELELPVACMVHSGKKSVHAIVRIEADTMETYRERVDFLYEVCKKNGLEIDRQNRNPSRLSRLPGVRRGDAKQFLIGTNLGKPSWQEWRDWIEDLNDDLPDIESLESVFGNLPAKSPELISGVLREGHKMRIAGPSKAGKSFLLDQLVIAIAEGRDWMGWPCAKGRVLYVNLELDRASCLHRFADIYKAKGWKPANVHNIDVWNLRGKAAPMDVLAPKLIRRAQQKRYKAVIIDPIYKVITGDENSADAMSHFCNQFDKICLSLGAAVIDCHHHSKGSQGGKRSADRASGSGVFARDPDALVDLIELDASEAKRVLENRTVCDAMAIAMCDITGGSAWREDIPMDDALQEQKFLAAARKLLKQDQVLRLLDVMAKARAPLEAMSAWRLEGTLREFAAFKPRNIWFRYPVHVVEEHMLNEAEPDGMEAPWEKKRRQKKQSASDRKVERKEAFFEALEACQDAGSPTVHSLAEKMGITVRSVRKYLSDFGYRSDSGIILKCEEGDAE